MANKLMFTIENALLFKKNFSGEEGMYNAKGRRNFCVVIPDTEMANKLRADGWKVFDLRPQEEGEEPTPAMQITVRFDPIPPQIVVVTSKARTFYSEDMVGSLDWASFAQVDIVVQEYNWNVNGKTGKSAYLKTMRAVLDEDFLQQKYADDFAPPAAVPVTQEEPF